MKAAPYKTVKRSHGYVPRSVLVPAYTIRPTRSAAGMTHTMSRTAHKLSNDASRLSISGTLDRLQPGLRSYFETQSCPCCGTRGKGKLSLNERGRLRLKRLRQTA